MEDLGQAVKDHLLLGELAGVGGLLQHAVPVGGGDDAVGGGDGDGVAEVLALELDAVHGDGDAVHLGLAGGVHGFFERPDDGPMDRLHVRDFAPVKAALGGGLARARHIDRPVFLVHGDDCDHFTCTKVEPEENGALRHGSPFP